MRQTHFKQKIISVFIGGGCVVCLLHVLQKEVYEALVGPSSAVTSKIYLCGKSRCRKAGGNSVFMSAAAYGHQLASMLCLGVVRSSNTA